MPTISCPVFSDCRIRPFGEDGRGSDFRALSALWRTRPPLLMAGQAVRRIVLGAASMRHNCGVWFSLADRTDHPGE